MKVGRVYRITRVIKSRRGDVAENDVVVCMKKTTQEINDRYSDFARRISTYTIMLSDGSLKSHVVVLRFASRTQKDQYIKFPFHTCELVIEVTRV